MMVTPVFIAP